MYKISVPVMNLTVKQFGAENTYKELKRFNAERVFLAVSANNMLGERKKKEFDALKENIPFFKSKGLEVGVWSWTFMDCTSRNFVKMCSPFGNKSEKQVCPLDENYILFKGDYIEEIAKLNPDIIMFDDDYRYTYHDIGFGCLCENHLKEISREVGEDVSLEFMREKLLYGEKNKYRDAFVKVNGDALLNFAYEMRKRVDNVNENIRMGYCTCLNSWDMDGVHPDELSTALAGKTKPFYRLIGAPYWAAMKAFGHNLSTVIEFERFECSQRKNKEIEVFSEGDAYPRPRYYTPAAITEGFDTALRVAHCTDGILKYGIDYTSSPQTETGYALFHEKNKNLYNKADEFFTGKTETGVRVYKIPDIYKRMTVPEKIQGTSDVQSAVYPFESRFLALNSIPATYTGTGITGIAFGEDVESVPAENYKHGLIIDIKAAEILKEKGVDTGLVSALETVNASYEEYENDRASLFGGAKVRKTKLKDNVSVDSYFLCDDEKIPASYRYENSNGERFFVLCYDGFFSSECLIKQYQKQSQIISVCEWLSGRKLPATVSGHPDLYLMEKYDENCLYVAIWNFSVDTVYDGKILFDDEYVPVETVNCSLNIDGTKGTLSDISPYGCVFLKLKKKS